MRNTKKLDLSGLPETTTLSQEDFERVLYYLDNPPPATKALAVLLDEIAREQQEAK